MTCRVVYLWHYGKIQRHPGCSARQRRVVASSTSYPFQGGGGVEDALRSFPTAGVPICTGGAGVLRAGADSRAEESFHCETAGKSDCRSAPPCAGCRKIDQRGCNRSPVGAPWRGEWTWPVRRARERLSGTIGTTGSVVRSWRVPINCSFRIGHGVIREYRSSARG